MLVAGGQAVKGVVGVAGVILVRQVATGVPQVVVAEKTGKALGPVEERSTAGSVVVDA